MFVERSWRLGESWEVFVWCDGLAKNGGELRSLEFVAVDRYMRDVCDEAMWLASTGEMSNSLGRRAFRDATPTGRPTTPVLREWLAL